MENSLYVYDLAYAIAVDSAGIYVVGEVGATRRSGVGDTGTLLCARDCVRFLYRGAAANT